MTGWFPRVVVAAAAAQFVIFVVRPVVSYQALGLDATPTQLGLVVASYSVISLWVCLPLGRGIDRYGELPFPARRFSAAHPTSGPAPRGTKPGVAGRCQRRPRCGPVAGDRGEPDTHRARSRRSSGVTAASRRLR